MPDYRYRITVTVEVTLPAQRHSDIFAFSQDMMSEARQVASRLELPESARLVLTEGQVEEISNG